MQDIAHCATRKNIHKTRSSLLHRGALKVRLMFKVPRFYIWHIFTGIPDTLYHLMLHGFVCQKQINKSAARRQRDKTVSGFYFVANGLTPKTALIELSEANYV